MVILDTSGVNNIFIVSRLPELTGGVAMLNIDIYHKADRTTTELTNVPAGYNLGVLGTALIFTSVEGEQYFFTLTDATDGKLLSTFNAYCTDQTNLQDFELQEGEFNTPPQSNNEFLTY